MEHMLKSWKDPHDRGSAVEHLFFRSVLSIGGFERIRIAFSFLRVLQPEMKWSWCTLRFPACPPRLRLFAKTIFYPLVLQTRSLASSPFLAFFGYISFRSRFYIAYGLARIPATGFRYWRAEKFVRRSMPTSKRVSARPRPFLVPFRLNPGSRLLLSALPSDF